MESFGGIVCACFQGQGNRASGQLRFLSKKRILKLAPGEAATAHVFCAGEKEALFGSGGCQFPCRGLSGESKDKGDLVFGGYAGSQLTPVVEPMKAGRGEGRDPLVVLVVIQTQTKCAHVIRKCDRYGPGPGIEDRRENGRIGEGFRSDRGISISDDESFAESPIQGRRLVRRGARGFLAGRQAEAT